MTHSLWDTLGHSDPAPLLRVLCLDDNRDAADTLGVLLELAGFQTAVFYDGPTALAAVESFRPDAALIDISMPGMDGCEVARRLRQWAGDRSLPLVALTALSGEEARRRTAEAGFDLHLTKPVDPDTLALLLADIVILRGDSGPIPTRRPGA
jgi:CheY-like chemotaxis protein